MAGERSISIPVREKDIVNWLEYVHSKNQFKRFLPRLKDVPAKRDEALAEIYVAYFIEKCAGYPVTTWEPPGDKGKLGEFSFMFGGMEIFCEVKSPVWEREIVESEGPRSPRLKKAKYLRGDHGWFDNSHYVGDTVAKAYPKFASDRATLLVLVDDFKVSLSDDPIDMWKALYKPNGVAFQQTSIATLALSQS